MDLRRHAISWWVATLVVGSVSHARAQASAQPRIGVVDVQGALVQVEDGQRARDRLERLARRRQRELERRQHELQELHDAIEENREVWSRETLQQRVEEYQRALVELQGLHEQYQRELVQQENDLTQPIAARMTAIVRRIGQAGGYTVIVDRSQGGVMFAADGVDLTAELVRRYEAGEGREDEPTARDDRERDEEGPETPRRRPERAEAPRAATDHEEATR